MYYTYCIRITNRHRVQVEKRNAQHQDLGRPSGVFRYPEKLQQIEPLLEIARGTGDQSLNDANKARELGEALFDVLFDDTLLHNFVEFYNEVVHQKKQLLRVELDVDERQMPEVAALPWEFLRVPKRANLGAIWMGTVPDLVFYRRRSQWNPPKPIQLERDEKLKIALVVSAPPDLKPVAYERVQKTLERLPTEQANRIELLPIVNSANPEKIDTILSKKPHIFHFIGHGRLIRRGDREVGEIALVDPELDEAMWVDADYFSELFARHRPSVVMLQACEGGKLSEYQAFTGVASGIIQQKIPVVVAMQYEVSNSTASRFACRFYQRLAEYKPVDIAAQEGRLAITHGPTQYRTRDFATPVIFMGVEDGYLFKEVESEVSNEPDSISSLITQLVAKLNNDRLPSGEEGDRRTGSFYTYNIRLQNVSLEISQDSTENNRYLLQYTIIGKWYSQVYKEINLFGVRVDTPWGVNSRPEGNFSATVEILNGSIAEIKVNATRPDFEPDRYAAKKAEQLIKSKINEALLGL